MVHNSGSFSYNLVLFTKSQSWLVHIPNFTVWFIIDLSIPGVNVNQRSHFTGCVGAAPCHGWPWRTWPARG